MGNTLTFKNGFAKLQTVVLGTLKNCPRKTKIANFNRTVPIKEQICRLNISMHDIGRMQKLESTQTVVNYYNNMILTELRFLVRLKHFFEIILDTLHDDEQVTVGILCVSSRHDHIQ